MYQKWQSYDVWFLRYKVRQAEFFGILGHFLPFQLPDNPEIKILKLKKTSGNIIILHICTINDNDMMYSSWDMERNRQNFLSFWTIFALLPLYGPRKSKFWKNEQHTWRYYFTNVYHKSQSPDVWFLSYEMQQTEFLIILDHFLPFYLPCWGTWQPYWQPLWL